MLWMTSILQLHERLLYNTKEKIQIFIISAFQMLVIEWGNISFFFFLMLTVQRSCAKNVYMGDAGH